MTNLMTPISPGELLDKLTILDIKSERIEDPVKLANVAHEKKLLDAVWASAQMDSDQIQSLRRELKQINERLWDIEDAIRLCEHGKDFGQRFVELARAVYITNDRRAGVKKQINLALGSAIVEEKSYQDY